jgi:(R,R)-butanediol dehydrogenase/meso-butanediol dehydrogenase/diacetyl reductase
MQAALHGGARRVAVIETDPARRSLSLSLGAVAAIDPAAPGWRDGLCDALRDVGPDLTVECGGSVLSVDTAIAAARKGGRVVLIGFPTEASSISITSLITAEIELIGSLAHVYDEDFAAAVDLLAGGRVRVAPLITHRLPLDQVVEGGFQRMAERDRSAIKILVQPM